MNDTNKHPLQTMLEAAEIGDVRSYSGRAMYGRECLAVTCNAQEFGHLIANLLRNVSMFDDGQDIEEVATAMQDMRWDNMGMDMVYYWPGIPYVCESEDEGEV